MRAEAGAVWDDVVVTSLAHGLGGLECLSGIPGSAGATPVQNVGAYGAEVADTIRRVRLLDRRTGEDRWVAPEALRFGYRTSILRHSRAAIVLEVEFALDADGRSAPLRYGELADALGADPDSARRPDPGARGGVVACARARAWFSTTPTTTPGASGRSSPTRSWPGRVSNGCSEAVEGPVPQLPGARRGEAGGGLAGRTGRFRARAIPATAAPVRLSTKHALALTNRGAATDGGRDCAGQGGTRRRANEHSGSNSHPSRF